MQNTGLKELRRTFPNPSFIVFRRTQETSLASSYIILQKQPISELSVT